jgi:putative ABC transport system permease protein
MFSILDVKLFRDLRKLWVQALAISLVLACGVSTIIIAVGAYRSLAETQSAFYERYRFGSIFSTVTRAPKRVVRQLSEISGVTNIETRIVKPVQLQVIGMKEPASGIVVSLPDHRLPLVNRLHVRNGRLPAPSGSNEVAVVETFARAHDFVIGDKLNVVLNGHARNLNIVGIVLSPEYIYNIGPGDMVPDERRFGVLFMSETLLSGIYDMEGAFNDVSFKTTRNAAQKKIIQDINGILKPYGGAAAYGRKDQISHAFLDAELDQLRGMARVIPPIFLFVAAFLVNMILNRLLALEREQIGLLKALGYSNFAISWHYAKLVIAIALVGLIIGSGFGWWAGRGLTRLYASFYSFPFLIFEGSIDLYVIAGGLSVGAALLGASRAIYSVVKLPPAVAMRPPAPTAYRAIGLKWLLRFKLLTRLNVMAVRHLLRWPVRSGLTILGVSMSVALLITSLFSYDSIDEMIDIIYFQTERQDATITFNHDQPKSAISLVKKIPGVIDGEVFRSEPVKLKNGLVEQQLIIVGTVEGANLSRILDQEQKPLSPLQNGLILSERVLAKLNLKVGDSVQVNLTRRDNRIVSIPIVAKAQSYVGLTAYTHINTLNRIIRDGQKISGVHVQLDSHKLDEVYRLIKATPAIAGVALQDISRQKFQDTVEQNITTMTAVYVGLAVIITFGVIYNSARIQLSERARELASLRVFGFTKGEVSGVLLTEIALIVLLALPLGWVLGWGFAWSVVKGFETDLFRIPLVIKPATFANASLVVLLASVFSTLIVRRRIDNLDLIRVLKTRE